MSRLVFGCLCALALAGCGLQKVPTDYADARDTALYGVPVQMDAAAAVQRIGRQNQYFMTLAGLPVEAQPPEKAGQLWPILPEKMDWPSITARGMADIDAVCTNYFKRLDDYADYRKSLRDGTGIVGSATTTLMAALNAAQGGIAIVSGLFGVSQGLMDTSSQASLFAIDPTKLYNLHAKAASAYRQSRRPTVEEVRSVGQAADMLGGYVTLCTPVSLKGLISESIERVQVGSTPDGRVGVEGANRSPLLEPLQIDQPLAPTPPPPPSSQVRRAASETERLLTRVQGETIQRALCVEPDGDFGVDTREGIAQYRQHLDAAVSAPALQAPLDLKEAIDLLGTPPCDRSIGYRNAWERFKFGTDASIQALQLQIGDKLGDQTVPQTGRFDDATRLAIAAFATRVGQPAGDQITPELTAQLAD